MSVKFKDISMTLQDSDCGPAAASCELRTSGLKSVDRSLEEGHGIVFRSGTGLKSQGQSRESGRQAGRVQELTRHVAQNAPSQKYNKVIIYEK